MNYLLLLFPIPILLIFTKIPSWKDVDRIKSSGSINSIFLLEYLGYILLRCNDSEFSNPFDILAKEVFIFSILSFLSFFSCWLYPINSGNAEYEF